MKANGDAVRPMKQHSNETCPLLLILLITYYYNSKSLTMIKSEILVLNL